MGCAAQPVVIIDCPDIHHRLQTADKVLHIYFSAINPQSNQQLRKVSVPCGYTLSDPTFTTGIGNIVSPLLV